jgi:hypothetical protein
MNKINSRFDCLRSSRTTTLLACLLLAGVVAACSSVKTYVNKAPVKASTFSFLNTGSRDVPSYAEASKQAHAMIQQAINRNLASKGVSQLPSGGDVTVAYLVVVGNNSTTTSLNSYFGYTDDSNAFVDKIHAQETGNESRGYFEEGTLVIDFVDPGTSKVLQRRCIAAPVLRNLSAENRSERIQTIVDQVLKDVPFAR